MSDISFSMTSDEKDVLRGLDAIGKAQGKLREEIAQLVNASKAAGAADNQLAQQRLAALNPILAKQKELKAQQAELAQQLKDGKITADQYKQSFDALAKESNGLTAKLNELQAQVREDTADMKKAATIIGESENKTQKYARAVAELDRLKSKGILTSQQHAQAIDAERAKMSDVGEASTKSGGLISGLTDKMGGFVAGLASGAAVIRTIKEEYDALLERQGKSRDANISLAAEQEALLMNLGDASAKDVTGQIRQLSQSSGVKEENVTRAVNEAMAARADLDIKDVLAAVETAAKVRKFAPSELAGLSSAVIDTQKQTGLDTDSSMGFLMQLQAQSRTTSLKGLAENFTPAVGGVMNFGADRQTAGGILAALSHGMGDATGAQTGTSAIQLAKQLREFSGGQDIGKVIGDLQNNPELRQKFLGNASFEAKALPAIESLLSGGTQAKQFSQARSALSQDPRLALQQAIANRDLPALDLAAKDQALANLTDQQKLGDVGGAESAISRDRLKEFRDQSGRWGMSSRAQGFVEDALNGGTQSAEQTVARMEAELSMLRSGSSDTTRALRGNAGLVGLAANLGGASLLESSNRNNPETQKLIAELEELVKLTREQIAATNGIKDANANAAHAGVVGARAAAGGAL